MSDYKFEVCKNIAHKCMFKGFCVLIGEEDGCSRCNEIIRFISVLSQNSNHLEDLNKHIDCPRQPRFISLHSCLRNQFKNFARCRNCQQKGRNILRDNDLKKLLRQIEKENNQHKKTKVFTITQGPDFEKGDL
jgi:hypothetical protein